MAAQITASELRNTLGNSVRRFQFIKLDGSLREALGTRDVTLIPKDIAPSWCDDVSEKSVVYFDLEVAEFRSVSVKSFIGLM